MRALLRQATILSLVARVVAPCAFTPYAWNNASFIPILCFKMENGSAMHVHSFAHMH